ncbi:UPF0705 protein C11orf49 homolog isoform X2 [Lingula anatina]|uniref:Centriolar satellite-associated tubulin polyglutamylase complex regulator 1 n=1 Tax=Lingula anatina TaxID=7574 RepID=A0A1S3IHY0_LINAN|nr:UPF0705 protein C11orf49 homolog isoform X1 [Lingula anatina]XP_023932694.1 UPF0705 protein C11orf49 homolog isoform X2 [Lingula anatina]|eukprot:XP_013397822.1 UPF0705 protein C11orf49 homolog isoform X1 [Lingula anatina]
MNSPEDMYQLTADQYLEKTNILIYIEDAVAQLLEHKEENPKVNPSKFFSDYFVSLREGNHTLFRDYHFIHATPHNRSSFVKTFWKCFRHVGKQGDLLSIQEYHALICLLCNDFPFETVQKTARIILMDDALDCLISFTDFLYAFQVQFYYEEFLEKCTEVYKALLSAGSPRETVVVPTSDEEESKSNPHQLSNGHHTSSDGVDSMQFYRALVSLSHEFTLSFPPLPILKELLSVAPRVSFYGFLMAIAKCEKINAFIGKLPSKSELLAVPDQDLTIPPIRPSTASRVANRPPSGTARPVSSTSDAGKPQPTDNKVPKSAHSKRSKAKPTPKPVQLEPSDASGASSSGETDSGSGSSTN